MLKEAFHFIYSWRSYQQRFLNNFEEYLSDSHLHVVAPPGSGKTVLGLEMMRRVDKKTLVLAPTITIRNQWEERMFECFIEEDTCKISLSRNIKNPAQITFATYQSLHAFAKNEMEGDMNRVLEFFAKAEIQHIILDEAHHLKNEWWKPLFALKKLEDCTLTALTATPPYDSEQREIAKYFQLCGPIDIEISVPELIKESNLCVHQDYIYFSEPEEAQIQYIVQYRMRTMQFLNDLVSNDDFGDFVLENTLYTLTDGLLDPIYEEPDFYIAILVYLNARGHQIPKEKIEVLGIEVEKTTLPTFNQKWAQELLQPILITHREEHLAQEELLQGIENQVKRIGALDKNRINFKGDKALYKTLAQSPNKLKSIREIINFESLQMGNELRAVILADYVRKEFLEEDDLSNINRLGVIPIFHHLRHSLEQHPERWQGENKLEKLAVLTGTLVIIHKTLEPRITTLLAADDYTLQSLPNTQFTIVKTRERAKNKIVRTMTQLFTDGHIEVLIGTAALLGEGWDAPAINTLVLASYVSSFVMSNQMRGRAIRVQKGNPEKVASIWHLACIDTTIEGGGEDVAKLLRRFDAFCGVSLDNDPFIENGADRFALPKVTFNKETLNLKMQHLASNRSEVTHRWKNAIVKGKLLIREFKFDISPYFKQVKTPKLLYRDVTKYSFLQLGALASFSIPEILINNAGTYFSRGMLFFIYTIIGGFMVAIAPRTYKSITNYLKYGRIDKSVYKMAQTVLKTLREQFYITTQVRDLKLEIEYMANGEIACYLQGATAKEEILFVDCLQELLDPVDNARYMIEKSGWLQNKFGFANYFSIPTLFTSNKKDASLFFKYWQIYVDDSELIFTRTKEGRKRLLKARFHYLSKEGDGIKTKASSIWK